MTRVRIYKKGHLPHVKGRVTVVRTGTLNENGYLILMLYGIYSYPKLLIVYQGDTEKMKTVFLSTGYILNEEIGPMDFLLLYLS